MDDEKLYTTSEILQVLYGLATVHTSKPWWLRIFSRPWYDALMTAALIFGGDKLVEQFENDKLLDDIDQYLG